MTRGDWVRVLQNIVFKMAATSFEEGSSEPRKCDILSTIKRGLLRVKSDCLCLSNNKFVLSDISRIFNRTDMYSEFSIDELLAVQRMEISTD